MSSEIFYPDFVRPINELRCHVPGCNQYFWNNPGGDFAGCPKFHGPLVRRLNDSEQAFILRQQIPNARQVLGDLYHVDGYDEPFHLGRTIREDFISLNSLLGGRRVYARIDGSVFIMHRVEKARVAAEPVVPPKPAFVQRKLALILE